MKQLLEELKEFAEAIKEGKVLEKYRVSKVVRNEDGTYKRVVSDPKERKNGKG
jgi:hypothetical protein